MRLLNIGDVVHLKSGSPEMTIRSISSEATVMIASCIWYDESQKEFRSRELVIQTLETYKGDDE